MTFSTGFNCYILLLYCIISYFFICQIMGLKISAVLTKAHLTEGLKQNDKIKLFRETVKEIETYATWC